MMVTDEPVTAKREQFRRRACLLSDGALATIREVTAEDRAPLLRLHLSASDSSIYRRFFSLNRTAAEAFVDHVCERSPTSWSLVAEQHGEIVGIATASLESPSLAEVALMVAEDHHGSGIGTILLEQLARWSFGRGVQAFVADVLGSNGPMLRVLQDAGFGAERSTDHSVVTVKLDIRPSAASRSASKQRQRQAAAARSWVRRGCDQRP